MKKEKIRKLVIVGAGEFGEIAYEYFTFDSEYEVVAFAVERKYYKKDVLKKIPIVEFENMENIYSPDEYDVFIAVTYVQLNKARRRLYDICKNKGYRCASYVSSHSFVWHNVTMGENVFVFENCIIQHHVHIGDNVVLWSSNSIGHRTIIEDDCWMAIGVVISGFCKIGKSSFIGANATLGDNVTIPYDTVLGAGAVTVKSLTQPGRIYIGIPAQPMEKTAYQHFEIQ